MPDVLKGETFDDSGSVQDNAGETSSVPDIASDAARFRSDSRPDDHSTARVRNANRDPRQLTDRRGSMDPRSAIDPRNARDARAAQVLPPPDDPRDTSVSRAYRVKAPPLDKGEVVVCDVLAARRCEANLRQDHRECDSLAEQCKVQTNAKHHLSCRVMDCDIDKALCMKSALDVYILCLDEEMLAAEERGAQ